VDFLIVNQHPELLKYVDYLQHKNAESLSFYPKSCLEREIKSGRILLSLLNGEPCGYLYHGALKGVARVHQICIQFDLRRKLYGALLVTHFEKLAIKNTARAITLRCGFDLDANQFWKDLGYSCIGIVDGGIRRQRKINIWQKALQPMFELPVFEPALGKQDASLWRKNKQTGIINQFARGKQLKIYKDIITPQLTS
jgi:hypothetical protein